MAEPVGTRVTLTDLGKVADILTTAADDMQREAEIFNHPGMWDRQMYRAMFGPATEVADRCATLTRMLPEYIDTTADSLKRGAQVFRTGLDRFNEMDTAGKNRIQPR